MTTSLEDPRAAERRVRDDFLCRRRCERMRSTSTSRNPTANPRVSSHGDDWEGPVTQLILFQISVDSVCNFYFTFGLIAGSTFVSFSFAESDS